MDKTAAVTALQNAVAFLKGQKIIKKEIDISLQTGYAKGSISAYLTGLSTPSKNFLAKFQEVYNLNLDDFAKESPVVENTHGEGLGSLLRIESLVRSQNAYVAEIYAQQAGVPATKVLKDMEQMAAAELSKLTGGLKKQ